MIFALDATPLTVSTGGIRRYTEELALALAMAFPADEFWLISDQTFVAVPGPGNLHSRTFASRRWWSLGLPRALAQLRADLFHGTDFSVPYLPLRPSILTLHDLSPFEKQYASSSPRVRRRTPVLLQTGIPTMVITPSQAVRSAAIERFSLKPDRIVAIPLAASEYFRPRQIQPVSRPYFLFVGTLEPRKNIFRLVDAWREVRKTHLVDLVLAGRRRDGFPALPDEPGLRVIGEVADEELPALYSGAVACVYPSLYEGFGLPVLEAMQCGALVITSNDPAILEVTGGAAAIHSAAIRSTAIHVDALDTSQMAQAMGRALAGCDATRQAALARAREFSWQFTAQRTREVYDAAIRVFSHS